MSKNKRDRTKRHKARKKDRKGSRKKQRTRRFAGEVREVLQAAPGQVQFGGPLEVKVSDLLLELALPLLAQADSDEAAKTAVDIAALAWNLSLFPAHERELKIAEVVGGMSFGDPEWDATTRTLLGTLVRRKLGLFPDVRRLIVHYELISTSGARRLNVASTAYPAAAPHNDDA